MLCHCLFAYKQVQKIPSFSLRLKPESYIFYHAACLRGRSSLFIELVWFQLFKCTSAAIYVPTVGQRLYSLNLYIHWKYEDLSEWKQTHLLEQDVA